MRFHNNIGPQVRRRRYSLGWSQSMLATKLQLVGFDISRSSVSKIEKRDSVSSTTKTSCFLQRC
jgi:transcriptional regulator with XRE-family HTH domain